MRIRLVLFLLVAACSGKGDTERKTPEKVAAPAAASLPKPAPGAALGVPECDGYRDKMLKCIAKLGPDAAGPAKSDLEDTWSAWQSAGQAPDGKAALAQACKAAADAARPVYAPSGCEL